MRLPILMAAAAAVFLTGCQTRDPYTGEVKTSNATNGAIIGAVLGAGVGALTHTHGCCAGENALAGAAIGGLAGGLIGQNEDYREAALRHRLERHHAVRIERRGKEIDIDMQSEVLFDTASADVSPQAQDIIAQVADVVRDDPHLRIEVDGYTDTAGDAKVNMELSQRRAENVADLLVDDGIDANRIDPVGLGETHLAVPTPDNISEPRNRRVVIRLDPHSS
ncbi:MAG TPA: OmpA family protein [Rhizomicrobium sp.]|jgi:outer membrane protein OmpA-like peptidoglycan-associated protein